MHKKYIELNHSEIALIAGAVGICTCFGEDDQIQVQMQSMVECAYYCCERRNAERYSYLVQQNNQIYSNACAGPRPKQPYRQQPQHGPQPPAPPAAIP